MREYQGLDLQFIAMHKLDFRYILMTEYSILLIKTYSMLDIDM